MKITTRHFGAWWVFWWSLMVVAIPGCGPIRLVAVYDEAIEKGVTDIQKEVEAILTKIERQPSNPSSTYESKDYENLREDLNVLRTRAAAWDKNEITVKMLYELGYQLLENPPVPITENEAADKKLDKIIAENSGVPMPTDKYFSLEKRHKMKDPFSAEDIRDLRAILEVHFRSLLRFETLKKRGVSAESN
jgi:hypothetical protein